jgi:tetratricopeptide (TPR) repeat protein
LLLLDYWPLNRFTPPVLANDVAGDVYALGNLSVPRRLILEKIPLLALSGAACVATMMVQKESITPLSLPLRIGNAAVSGVTYLGQMVCPAGLAVFYPYSAKGSPPGEITLAFILLAAISAGVFFWRQKRPYLLIGWLWYLGMLVPVIGLVQVGLQAHADRYTYLPQIGLGFALTWAVAELSAGWRHRRWVLGGLATMVIAGLSFYACRQTSYWENSQSLWTHTLAVTADNYIAHDDLGEALAQAGRLDEAIAHFQKAVELRPDLGLAQYDLGTVLLQKGRVDEAIVHFQKVLAIKPDNAGAHFNLGVAFLQKGQVDEAIVHFQQYLKTHPDVAEAHDNLGTAFLQKGRLDEAIADYQKAVQLEPQNAVLQRHLGHALLQRGRLDEAMVHFQTSLGIQPADAVTCKDLAWLLATSPEASVRNGSKAVELAEQAVRLSGGADPAFIDTLAAAYAEAGRFPEAVGAAQRAQQLAAAQNNTTLVDALQVQIGRYQAGSPFRDNSLTNTRSAQSGP